MQLFDREYSLAILLVIDWVELLVKNCENVEFKTRLN